MKNKEYSLAHDASEFFRNMSLHFKDGVNFDINDLLIMEELNASLTSLDQSDDILELNLESIKHMIQSF